MSTPVICPGCQQGFAAAAELRGKKVKCPSCGAAISIPGAPAAPAAAPQQVPQMPTPQQWPAPQQGFDSTQPSWLGMGQPTQSFQQSWPGQTATYQPPRAEAPASITTAATMLFIAAGLGVVQHVLGIIVAAGMAMGSIEMEGPEDVARGGVWVVVGVIGLPCDGFIIYGAIQMLRLKGHSTAQKAATLAIVPILGCGICVGAPAGFWTLHLLNKPEIRNLFR